MMRFPGQDELNGSSRSIRTAWDESGFLGVQEALSSEHVVVRWSQAELGIPCPLGRAAMSSWGWGRQGTTGAVLTAGISVISHFWVHPIAVAFWRISWLSRGGLSLAPSTAARPEDVELGSRRKEILGSDRLKSSSSVPRRVALASPFSRSRSPVR